MKAKETAIIDDCHSFLSIVNKGMESRLSSVYYRTNETDAIDVKACAVLGTRSKEIVVFDPYRDTYGDTRLNKRDFNVDYDLEALSDGFKILYMPLEEHKNIWLAISNQVPQNSDGLQKYLLYCKQHGITKELIESISANNIKDAMSMYHEKNENYEIISSMNIDNTSIVVGHNPKAPQPYVVWDCDVRRKYGYRNGSYHSVKEDALEVFKIRCKELVDKLMYMKISDLRSKKEKER